MNFFLKKRSSINLLCNRYEQIRFRGQDKPYSSKNNTPQYAFCVFCLARICERTKHMLKHIEPIGSCHIISFVLLIITE